MHMNTILKEYRCYVNNKLLFKANGDVQLEIVNPTNRVINYIWPGRKWQDIWPKGTTFQQHSIDLHCKKCKRLLARCISTEWLVETKCKHCHEVTLFDTKEIQAIRLSWLSSKQKEVIIKAKKVLTSTWL